MSIEDLTRHERQAQRRKEREVSSQSAASNQGKARLKKKVLVFVGIIALVAAVVYGASLFNKPVEPEGPSALDPFAKCLTEKGAIMYGTEWCPHCQAQKKMFGTSWQYASYVDCDASSGICNAVNVRSYPTWIFASGERVSGTQDLNSLAAKSGCNL